MIIIVAVITNLYGIPYIQLLKIFIGTQISLDCFVTHERFAAIVFELISID